MTLKVLGVILVIAGCGGVGFRIAANHHREERSLRQLINILNYMECELQYRLTALPDLCRQAAKLFRGMPGVVFKELALEMDAQIAPDMDRCMSVAISKVRDIPKITFKLLESLGKSMGKFDLDGQLKGLAAARQDCKRCLDSLEVKRDTRVRSYQTLGLCAGAALAILLI